MFVGHYACDFVLRFRRRLCRLVLPLWKAAKPQDCRSWSHVKTMAILEGRRQVIGVMEKYLDRFGETEGWGFEDFKFRIISSSLPKSGVGRYRGSSFCASPVPRVPLALYCEQIDP